MFSTFSAIKLYFNRERTGTLVLLLLILMNYILDNPLKLFGGYDIVFEGYEKATLPFPVYMVDLSMYIIYALFSLLIILLIPREDILLLALATVHGTAWLIDLIEFTVFFNRNFLFNLKDYVFLVTALVLISIGVSTFKITKGNWEEIINIANLRLLKWFIPKTEAEKALKNSQRNLELEQKLLRSQMNPHFIFNSLTSIQNFIYTEKPEVASAYLGKFAKLMRLILENSREEFIPFEKEVETLQLYLELQKVRFGNRFEYEIFIDPLIDFEEVAVPPMFAQPFIENSLEHGIPHKSEKGEIKIRFIQKDDSILFEVEDNGIGREKAALINRELKSDHQSYATRITEERLALISPDNQQTEMVNVIDVLNESKEVCGTKASFNIPYTRE